MYAIVPAIEGVPQIGFYKLLEGISISENQAVVHFEGLLEEGWQQLTEEEFREFVSVVSEPGTIPETIEQKLTRLEEKNLILMDALATTFEEVLALRAIVEGGTVS